MGVSRVQCFVAAHIHNDISVEVSRGTELNDGKGREIFYRQIAILLTKLLTVFGET